MEITLKDESMEVTLSSFGAVLHGMRKDGVEYLWQGDPAIWGWRDHNLFPYVGRLPGETYRLGGKEYSMPIHGFCIDREFEVEEIARDRVTFLFRDSEETRKMYPCSFALRVRYTLTENRLLKEFLVDNAGNGTMYFGIGSHPGFRVPLEGGEFSDWYLEFSKPSRPNRVFYHNESILRLPDTKPYGLEEGKRIPLSYEIFAEDAITLEGADRTVSLRSEKSRRSITVSYPDTPYVSFWTAVGVEAPYLCIEPWHSLPALHGREAVLEEQPDLVALEPGEQFRETMEIVLT